jgi:hypothetical protein
VATAEDILVTRPSVGTVWLWQDFVISLIIDSDHTDSSGKVLVTGECWHVTRSSIREIADAFVNACVSTIVKLSILPTNM